MRFPAPKRSRARTGKEFLLPLDYYDFTVVTTTNKPDPFTLSIEHFRFTVSESSKLHEFMTHATSYSLLKYSIGEEQQLLTSKGFFSIATNVSKPEVELYSMYRCWMKWLRARTLSCMLLASFNAEYISKHNHKYLVLE